jgi:hypothetical protein
MKRYWVLLMITAGLGLMPTAFASDSTVEVAVDRHF